MANFHRFEGLGSVAGEVRHQSFNSGACLTTFGIRVNFTQPKRDPTTGEWTESDGFWMTVNCWDGPSRKLAQYSKDVKKGDNVYVAGRLRQRKFTDKNNEEQTRIELTVDEFQLIGPRVAPAATSAQSSSPDRDAAPATDDVDEAPAPKKTTTKARTKPKVAAGAVADSEKPDPDAIPF